MLYLGTETPLAASATWKSDIESYPGYPVPVNLQLALVGTVFSDVAGSLYVDQSPDGVNWDVSSTAITVAAGVGQALNEPLTGFYVRLRYVNGAAAQTEFRLATTLNDSGPDEPV